MIFSFLPKRWFSQTLEPGKSLAWNILLSNLLLLLGAGLAANIKVGNLALDRLPGICLVKTLVGIPCPGCGITRGLMFTLRGNFSMAIAHNPVSILIVVFIAFQAIGQACALLLGRDEIALLPVYRVLQVPVIASLLLFWAFRVLITG